jgi:hypothetical protein
MNENSDTIEICLYFDMDHTGWEKREIIGYDLSEKKKEETLIGYVKRIQKSDREIREPRLEEYTSKLQNTLHKISRLYGEHIRESGFQYREIERKADEIISKITIPYDQEYAIKSIEIIPLLRKCFYDKVNHNLSVGIGVVMNDAKKACDSAKLKESGAEISDLLKELFPELKIPEYLNSKAFVKS